MLKNFMDKHSDRFYLAFRVLVGFLFLLHGWMKIGTIMSLDLINLMFYAGIIEIVGGIMIILGLFTRWVAIIAAVEMLVAYFKAHAGSALSPLVNKGEPALLFFAAFLVLMTQGAKKYSLDNLRKN